MLNNGKWIFRLGILGVISISNQLYATNNLAGIKNPYDKYMKQLIVLSAKTRAILLQQ